jgi:hypothetical protein
MAMLELKKLAITICLWIGSGVCSEFTMYSNWLEVFFGVQGLIDPIVTKNFFNVFSGFRVWNRFYEYVGVLKVAESF